MTVRFSLALLLSLLVAAPSHAQFLRRAIGHSVVGNAVDSAFCQSDAARLCPGVADQGSQMQCLMQYKDQVSLPCKKELRKLARRSGE